MNQEQRDYIYNQGFLRGYDAGERDGKVAGWDACIDAYESAAAQTKEEIGNPLVGVIEILNLITSRKILERVEELIALQNAGDEDVD